MIQTSMDRRRAQALSQLDQAQLTQLSQILSKAEGVALLTQDVGDADPPLEARRQAILELKAALSNSDDLRQTVQAALRLQSLASLPPGQRPKEWEGPTPAELFDLTTTWARLYPIKWWQFEHLVAETFKRLGFDDVRVFDGALSGDGGVDIHMSYQGAPCIVQCKHHEADEYVQIDRLRAFAHVAEREKATGYFVTSGKVGVTARKAMSQADPQVFVVDGEWLWKWIGRARGTNKEEVFVPGRQAPQASSESAADPSSPAPKPVPDAAAKSGCMPVIALCMAVVFALIITAVHVLA